MRSKRDPVGIDFGFGVFLSAVNWDDREILRKWRNDPRIWRWCRQCDVISAEDQDQWFRSQANDLATRMWMIETTANGFVGVAGLTSIDWVNRRAEFSLYVAPGRQGAGIGRRALGTLLSHGFFNLNLHLIWGEVFQRNPALTLFRRLGFRKEGMRRDFYFRNGRFIPATLISMKREEWTRRLRSLSWS